jgi:hypothetical protein
MGDSGFTVSNPKLVRLDGRVVAVVERWNSWWPQEKNYRRFLWSTIRPELRAEYRIYSLDLERGTLAYLFPGHDVRVSPNRELAAYMGSENGFSGLHTIRVWKIGGESKPVLSLTEIDPGSGISFSYDWTADSNALVIRGSTQGFSGSARKGKFGIAYSLERDSFFDLTSKTGA